MPLAEQAAVSAMLGALEGTHKAFLYTQGIWDYGATGPALATEESPFQPAAFFADSVERELQLRAAIAPKAVENIARQAFRMDSENGRIA